MRLWSGQYGGRKWSFILLAAADFKASWTCWLSWMP